MRIDRFAAIAPFVRHHLRTKLVVAGLASLVCFIAAGHAMHTLARAPNIVAKGMRVALHLELPQAANCLDEHVDDEGASKPRPICLYDNARYAQEMAAFTQGQQARLQAIAHLDAQAQQAQQALATLRAALADTADAAVTSDERMASVQQALAQAIVPLRPGSTPSEMEWRQLALARTMDWSRPLQSAAPDRATLDVLAAREEELNTLRSTLTALRSREWQDDEGRTTASVPPALVDELLQDATHPFWEGGWSNSDRTPLAPAFAHYASPLDVHDMLGLWSGLLFGLAAFLLVVVGPTFAAVHVAREREANTLPVLRMTGLSGKQLAAALAARPNVWVFSLAAGLLTAAVPLGCMGVASVGHVLQTLALVGALSVATHLMAMVGGDMLGQRVGSLTVGGAVATLLLGSGAVGSVLLLLYMPVGYLFGPLPLVANAIVGVAVAHAVLPTAETFGTTLFLYSLLVHGGLAGLCMRAWQRRIDEPWSPLFRPHEAALAMALSLGQTVLAVLSFSHSLSLSAWLWSGFDTVNAVTVASASFLAPWLAWLWVHSIKKPPHRRAAISARAARHAFVRFQGVLAATAIVLALTYAAVAARTGLSHMSSEIMWATLTQGLLAVETLVGTLLLAARASHNRHRPILLGTVLVAMQIAFAGAVYRFESFYVAVERKAMHPFLLGTGVSGIWIVALVLLWALGLGLILTAILREHDRERLEAEALDNLDADDDDDADAPQKWLH